MKTKQQQTPRTDALESSGSVMSGGALEQALHLARTLETEVRVWKDAASDKDAEIARLREALEHAQSVVALKYGQKSYISVVIRDALNGEDTLAAARLHSASAANEARADAVKESEAKR